MNSAANRPRPARDTAVEGLFYLLAQAENYPDVVSRYGAAEMEEVFTADQRARLGRGEIVLTPSRFGGPTRWTDMVATARKRQEGVLVSL